MIGCAEEAKHKKSKIIDDDLDSIVSLEQLVHQIGAKSYKVGVKQSQKALDMSYAHSLYVAKDAEQHVIRHVVDTANTNEIPVYWIHSMKELGHLCKIDVGAAIAVVTK